MGLTIPMRMSDNVKHRDVICFKFGERFFTSLTMLELKSRGSIRLQSKEIYFYIAVYNIKV